MHPSRMLRNLNLVLAGPAPRSAPHFQAIPAPQFNLFILAGPAPRSARIFNRPITRAQQMMLISEHSYYDRVDNDIGSVAGHNYCQTTIK